MIRYTTLEELKKANPKRCYFGVLSFALKREQEIAGPTYSPEDDGSVWLLEETDTDAAITEIFGYPLMQLPFERVRYNPDEEHFLCHLVRNNSRCDTIVIPDLYWLDEGWRAFLVSEI